MMWLALFLFGVIQGIGEFLPISSSGHLTLFQFYSDQIPEGLTLNIAVHFGTLLTIFFYYRKKIGNLIKGIVKKDPLCLQEFLLIVVASVPTALIGLGVKKWGSSLLLSPMVTAVCFFITGLVLFSTRYIKFQSDHPMSLKKAFFIGFIQGIAVLPGLSRSGLTIVTALWLKVSKPQAAEFSFLISLPAILGACLLELLGHSSENIEIMPLLVAMTTSFIVGLWAIGLVVQLTKKSKLDGFSYYVWALGAVVLWNLLEF